jgi:hypothetical protein
MRDDEVRLSNARASLLLKTVAVTGTSSRAAHSRRYPMWAVVAGAPKTTRPQASQLPNYMFVVSPGTCRISLWVPRTR